MSTVGQASLIVGVQHLAPALKTGAAKVMSTAIMAALMEEAACVAITNAKVERASVGVALSLTHDKPSAPGANVYARATIKDLTPKTVAFEVEAYDDVGIIGRAEHKRVFVDQEKFEQRCYSAAQKAQNK